MALDSLGKMLLLAGGAMMLAGAVMLLASRIGGPGRLPGDFVFQRGNFTFAFPLATMLIVSLALTIILNLVFRLWRR